MTSRLELFEFDDTKPREKMSKSRGNVVRPDEVVYGVAELSGKYEFRDEWNDVIDDYKKLGVWRSQEDGFYYTATRFDRRPVFLHFKDNPVPALFGGKMNTHQHTSKIQIWQRLLAMHWTEEDEQEFQNDYERAGVYSKYE